MVQCALMHLCLILKILAAAAALVPIFPSWTWMEICTETTAAHSLATTTTTSLLPNRTIPISRLTSSFAHTTHRERHLCTNNSGYANVWVWSARCLRYLIFRFSLCSLWCVFLVSRSRHTSFTRPCQWCGMLSEHEMSVCLRMPVAAAAYVFHSLMYTSSLSLRMDGWTCVRSRAFFFHLF